MSLFKSTIVNVIWSFFEQMLRKGTAIITTLVLALLLTPDDFGLVAMLTLFMAMGYAFIDGGLRAAVIRYPDMSEATISSVFYFNVLVGFVAYVLLFLLAPTVAIFYQQDSLTDLIRVAALSLFFQAFSVIPNAVMQRNLQYKLQFKTTLPAALISSLLAILLAYLGLGAWSIIWQMVVFSFVNSFLYWWLGDWRPTSSMKLALLRPLFKFSSFVFLENITKEFYGKVYLAAVGKFFILGVAGLYFFAKKFAEMLVQQLVSAIQQVTFPALARVQNDELKLKEGYRKVIQLTAFLLFPIFLLIATTSTMTFQLFLPEKWWGAAELLKYMMLIAILEPLHSISTNILLVKEKARESFYFSVMMMLFTLISLYFTVHQGIEWVLVGELIVVTLVYAAKMIYLSRLMNYTLIEQMVDLIPVTLIALMLSMLFLYLDRYFLMTLHLWVEFILFSCSYVVSYVLFSWLFNVQGFRLAKQLVLSRRKHLD